MSLVRVASRQGDFDLLGIQPSPIVAREDGFRTTGGPGTYEWWYFDTHLEDGSSLVLVFYTKPFIEGIGKGLTPTVTGELNRPDGSVISFQDSFPAEAFSASTDRAEVIIGANSFRNVQWSDDGAQPLRYAIHVEHEDVAFDVELVGQVPPWRPGSGYIYFGENDERFFAWLPSVPQGQVTLRLNAEGTEETLHGVGYHDHNWGNAPMQKLINHWYWGRAQAGPYSIVASYITAEQAYGDQMVPIFMLARNGQLIADDPSKVTFSLEDVTVDKETGKPFGAVVTYEYNSGAERYIIRFTRSATIVHAPFIDNVKGMKHVIARIMHVDGAYLRFTGEVSLERFIDGQSAEKVSDHGIWELMYFGHVR